MGRPLPFIITDVDDLEQAKSSFEDAYQGEYGSFLEYATQIFDELYAHDIPEYIQGYIDYEAFARDLEAEGYYIESGHVFRPV
jgi:antirestriction protein